MMWENGQGAEKKEKNSNQIKRCKAMPLNSNFVRVCFNFINLTVMKLFDLLERKLELFG